MSTIRRLASAPGRRREIACLHGHVRWIDPAWEDRLAAGGLPPDADWLRLTPGRQVSESKVTNCFRIECADGESLYFKRYDYTRHKKMRFFLRPGRAATEVFGYRQLAAIGIDTLQVVAFGEHRRLGRLVSACIVTRGVPNSRDLLEFARHEWTTLPGPHRKAVLAEIRSGLFEQLRRAHAANFFHQDLHWRNLLLVNDGDGYRTVWIDCPRARYQRWRREHAMLADLSTLSRAAPHYLTPRQRFESLKVFFGDRRPYATTRRWFVRIVRHHPPGKP